MADSVGFGPKLRALRKAHGQSAAQLGNLIGISKTAVYHYENGKNTPTHKHLLAICELYNIKASSLFFGENENDSPDADIHNMVALLNDQQKNAVRLFLQTLTVGVSEEGSNGSKKTN